MSFVKVHKYALPIDTEDLIEIENRFSYGFFFCDEEFLFKINPREY